MKKEGSQWEYLPFSFFCTFVHVCMCVLMYLYTCACVGGDLWPCVCEWEPSMSAIFLNVFLPNFGDRVSLNLELSDLVREFQGCSCLRIPHAEIRGMHYCASFVWSSEYTWTQVLNSGPPAPFHQPRPFFFLSAFFRLTALALLSFLCNPSPF